MTEKKVSKVKYIGEVLTTMALCLLLVIFRIAVPVRFTLLHLPKEYGWLLSELVYLLIEGTLIVVLVNHLIFKDSYKEMGLKNFKASIPGIIGNFLFLALVFGISYGFHLIGGTNSSMNIMVLLTRVIMSFVSIAFLQELIYRGCILNHLMKLTQFKALVAIPIATLLFAMIHIPLTLLQSDFEILFEGNINQIVMTSLAIGLYFNLLYYTTHNLWSCIIIHGTYIGIEILADDLLKPIFGIIYGLGAIIYLIYCLIKCKKIQSEDNEYEEEEEVRETEEEERESQITTDEKAEFNQKLDESQQILEVEQNQKLGKQAMISAEDEIIDLSQAAIINVEGLEKKGSIDLEKTTIIKASDLDEA